MSHVTCVARGLQLKPRVLLADDYTELHDAITRLLTASCDVVGCVSDGLQVLESATKLRPDVVVVDVHMPGMNGLEVCRRLRAALPRVKIILFTASDDASVRSTAMALGASALVVKYRAAFDLLPAIENALANEEYVPSCALGSRSVTQTSSSGDWPNGAPCCRGPLHRQCTSRRLNIDPQSNSKARGVA